jgi:hypothetical protein
VHHPIVQDLQFGLREHRKDGHRVIDRSSLVVTRDTTATRPPFYRWRATCEAGAPRCVRWPLPPGDQGLAGLLLARRRTQSTQTSIFFAGIQTSICLSRSRLLRPILPSLYMSKWFYDTFTGAAIGAARCSSFMGKTFSLLVVSSM